MRIAVVDNLPEGGARRVVYEQVRGLSKKHDVYWYTNTDVSVFPIERYVKETRRFDWNLPEHHGLFRVLTETAWVTHLLPMYLKVATEINRSKANVVLVHPDKLLQAPMLIPWLTKPKVYFMEEWYRLAYEPEWYGYTGTQTVKQVYEAGRLQLLKSWDYVLTQAADKLLTTSEFNRKQIQQAYRVSAEVVPLGVDTKQFTPNPRVEKKYFLFVGAKDRANGYDLVLEALKKLHERVRVKTIAFNGGSFAKSEAELVSLYQGAVATLCLGRNEPFGLTALESMACGTPVIALDEGGYTETVQHGETGWLIEPEAKVLAEAIRNTARDTEWREQSGKRGRSWVKEAFSWQTHVKRLTEILEEVQHD